MAERWIENGGYMLGVLSNEERTLLLFSESPEVSFNSVMPDLMQSSEMVRFLLENGQEDEYHISNTIPNELAELAIQHFVDKGEMYQFVSWKSQSGEIQ